MARLKYKTQAVNTDIDPAGGYICRVINADPVEDDAVFQEVIDALRLTESVFGLKKAVEAVIDTAMRKTASDGVPRKVGGLFRTYITIKGKVPNGDSPFVSLAGRGAGAYVRWGLSSEVQREVDYNAVSISNVKGGQSVAVSSIAYNGAEENALEIRSGVPILVTGRNLAYIDGDLVTVSRMVDGAEVVLATLTPEESDYYHQSYAWPSALDGVAAGSELKFAFRLRGGDPEASPVIVAKTVKVSAGAEPGPEPTPELTLTSIQTAGVQEGQVNETNTTSIRGQDNLYPWDSERDSVVVHFDGQELTVPDVEFSAGNETLQFQIPQRVGEVLDDDDTLSFTVTINGAVGTIDAVWKH